MNTLHIALTPTLARLSDWVPLIVLAIMIVGGWISSAMKNSKKPRQPRGVLDPRELQELDATSSQPQRRLSMDEMAARRREQLQELARRRQRAMGGQAQPSNLTAGQVDERARAKAAYESRAEELRRAAEDASRSREAAAQPQRGVEDVRRRQEREAQVRAQRERLRAQREAQQRAQQQAQQRAAAAQRQRAQQVRAAATPPAGVLGSGVLEVVDEIDREADHGESVVHRHVRDAEAQVEQARVAKLFGKPLAGQSLREAFVLKEVLDKPLALR